MTYYFANTFSKDGIISILPELNSSIQIITIRGLPRSIVNIFLRDLKEDLSLQDIPIQSYSSCYYPDTPDILIIPILKRVILHENILNGLQINQNLNTQELDLAKLCSKDLLEYYQRSINELMTKKDHYQKQGLNFLSMLPLSDHKYQITNEMLLLLQSLFPITAEDTGKPERRLYSSITSRGWISHIEPLTASFKRRYIIHSSTAFLKSFFQLVESKAINSNMECTLLINPLLPNENEGIIFQKEKQLIIAHSPYYSWNKRPQDVELYLAYNGTSPTKNETFEHNLSLAINSLVKAHSYREELDEYYWYSLDLDQIFQERIRLMHQLLSLCDGQELWNNFI